MFSASRPKRALSRTSVALLLIKITVPAFMLWLVARKVEWSVFFELTARISVGAILTAMVLVTIQNVLVAWRWWLIMGKLSGDQLKFSAALRYLFVSLLVNQAFLSSIGGDAVRILLAHKSGLSLANSIKSVILDRILTIFSLILLTVMALPLVRSSVPTAPGNLLFVVVVSMVVLAVLALYMLNFIGRCFARFPRFNNVVSFFLDLRSFLLSWDKITPPTLSAMAGFTIMTLIVFTFAKSLDVTLTLVDCFVLCPPVFFVAALPISVAGWGVRETAMIVALGYMGIPAETALVLSVALGLVGLAGSLPGMAFLSQVFEDRTRRVGISEALVDG